MKLRSLYENIRANQMSRTSLDRVGTNDTAECWDLLDENTFDSGCYEDNALNNGFEEETYDEDNGYDLREQMYEYEKYNEYENW